ncbi:putative sugar transporter protein [Neofusicoccum parvum UCRNP2]|uniref:Putative sugar transporter protein n=1 Tax=Botryosphaeria parva (strain UCR-NP2) TaxID=1287680 RepID=R1EU60_BOTPV|nr:putative sugar transporter protein [Neofusicoccum parvum UCRNP2]
MLSQKANARKAVGDELAAVLPQTSQPWYRKTNLLRLNFCILSLVLFSSANGYDGSLMNGLQALDQWHEFMDHPTGSWLGFINAVQSIGSLFQFSLVAWAGNRYGRKPCVAVGYIFLVLGVGLQTGARNPTMFILGRFFIGCVSAWYTVTTPLLIAETAFPTQRGILTSMFNCGWYVGAMLAAWVTYGSQDMVGSWSWRVPSLLQAGLPIVGMAGYALCPESPRWLVSQGRVAEARAFFAKYHAEGDEHAALVDFELAEVQSALTLEAEANQSASYADMLRTKGNRHRLFISVTLGVFAQWNGVGNVSYYLAAVLDTAGISSVKDQTLINGCIQIWNLAVCVCAASLVDRLGRRPLLLASCAGMLASYITISALAGSYDTTGNKATGIAVIPMLFLYYGFYDISFTPMLFAYPCEIWNYGLRARGLTVTVTATQLALFFNTFVNPIALEDIKWRYYVVFAVILVFVALTCYYTYPETRGHSLEEIARIFDGDDAVGVAPGWAEEDGVVGEKGGGTVHREVVGGEKGA